MRSPVELKYQERIKGRKRWACAAHTFWSGYMLQGWQILSLMRRTLQTLTRSVGWGVQRTQLQEVVLSQFHKQWIYRAENQGLPGQLFGETCRLSKEPQIPSADASLTLQRLDLTLQHIISLTYSLTYVLDLLLFVGLMLCHFCKN